MYQQIVTSSIVLVLMFSLTLLALKVVTDKKPNVWLIGYQEQDTYNVIQADKQFQTQDQFQNFLVLKNESDYTIYEETYSVDFACEADYPVVWKFPFPNQLADITPNYRSVQTESYRISEFPIDYPSPVNRKFKILIRMQSAYLGFVNTNLTCISQENTFLQSSVHLFLHGIYPIENNWGTIQVFVPLSPKPLARNINTFSSVVLPCRPASPEVQLCLEHKISARNLNSSKPQKYQNPWKKLTWPSDYISFDPKVGFTLQGEILYDMLYRCSVYDENTDECGDNTNNYVYVKVTISNQTKSDSKKDIMTVKETLMLRGKASVTIKSHIGFGRFPTQEISCCTGTKGKLPKLYIQPCYTSLQCQLAKKLIYDEIASSRQFFHDHYNILNGSNGCYKERFYDSSAVVVCQAENIEYEDQFVSIFRPEAQFPVTNRSQRILETYPKYENKSSETIANPTLNPARVVLTKLYNSRAVKASPPSQRILLIVARHIKHWDELRNTSEHKCSGSNNFFQYDDQGNYKAYLDQFTDFINLNGFSFLMIEYKRDIYYEGEKIIFICFGIKYFYAQGSHLRLIWKNGTTTPVKTNQRENANRFVYFRDRVKIFPRDFMESLETTVGLEITANQEMSKIECWLPVRDGGKWEKNSKTLEVLPTVAPKFVEEHEEIVYFYAGDVGREISCKIERGLPKPTVKVFRDNEGKHVYLRKFKNDSDFDPIANITDADFVAETITADNIQLIKLRFYIIQDDHKGIYQCVASNVNSTVTRTIIVVVSDKPSVAVHVSLGISGILFIVLVGLFMYYCHRKWNKAC